MFANLNHNQTNYYKYIVQEIHPKFNFSKLSCFKKMLTNNFDSEQVIVYYDLAKKKV